jgi:undecaprenyl diphosphate synthase
MKHNPGIHVAIIMDGNGRWALRRGLPRIAGHRAGVEAVRRVVERAPEIGIDRLTLYAFSSDNWRRPAAEVQSIFWLLRAFLRLETNRLRTQGVRLQAIGRRDRIPLAALRAIEEAERVTASCCRLELCVAIDYSSRDAILRAAASVVEAEAGTLPRDLVYQRLVHLLAGGSRDVDLLIRTGGEKRLSDFLLWESAYAEFVFTDRMWPDFDETDLEAALLEFKQRDRRFGALPLVVATPDSGLCDGSSKSKVS